MGIVDNNIFTAGIRGSVDDKMVFRKVGKETSVYVKRKGRSLLLKPNK